MADWTVGFGGKRTIGEDFTKHLAAVGRTITAATVTADVGTIANVTFTTTKVMFRFDATAITGTDPTPVTATVKITPTYDNGDTDPRWKTVQITRPS